MCLKCDSNTFLYFTEYVWNLGSFHAEAMNASLKSWSQPPEFPLLLLNRPVGAFLVKKIKNKKIEVWMIMVIVRHMETLVIKWAGSWCLVGGVVFRAPPSWALQLSAVDLARCYVNVWSLCFVEEITDWCRNSLLGFVDWSCGVLWR